MKKPVIVFEHDGDFSKTRKFFNILLNKNYRNVAEKYGKLGVTALSNATPVDTGLTALSWTYNITERSDGSFTISWYNTNEVGNSRGYFYNLIVLLEYGHATRSGTWVSGKHFVNDAMKKVLNDLEEALIEELRN